MTQAGDRNLADRRKRQLHLQDIEDGTASADAYSHEGCRVVGTIDDDDDDDADGVWLVGWWVGGLGWCVTTTTREENSIQFFSRVLLSS